MKTYEATEQAYKNGYEAGKKAVLTECDNCAKATTAVIESLQKRIATDNKVGDKLSPAAYKSKATETLTNCQQWISLSEQKPDRDTLVLVFFEGMRDTPAAIQVMYGWCIGGSASHWMPLPEPPKGE